MSSVDTINVPHQLAATLSAAKAMSEEAQATCERQKRGEYISLVEETSCMLYGHGFMEKPVLAAEKALEKATHDMATLLMRLALHNGQPKTVYYDSQEISDSSYRATPSMNIVSTTNGIAKIPLDLACRLAAAKADAIAAANEFKRLESNVSITEDTAIAWRLRGRNKLMAPAMNAHNKCLVLGFELVAFLGLFHE